MKLVRFMLQHSRHSLILAVIAGVVGGAASAALLVVISAGLKHDTSSAGRLILMFVALTGVALAARAASAVLLQHIGQQALFKCRMELCRQILGVPLRQLEEIGLPRLIGVLTDDAVSILNAVSNFPQWCVNLSAMITCLVFLAWLSPILFLVVAGAITVGLITYQLPMMIAARHLAKGRMEHNNVLGHVRSLVSGIKELKLNRGRRQAFFTGVQESAARFQRHAMSAMKTYVLGNAWGELMAFFTIGLLVFTAPHLAHVSDKELTTFVFVVMYVLEPVGYLMNQAPAIGKANVAVKVVEQMGLTLAARNSEEEPFVQLEPTIKWNSLELVNVGFSYQRDDGAGRFVLGPIDLSFTAGEVVFLSGGNGSGKTTLAKVLCGLYQPEQGTILLDGQAIDDQNRDNFRQYFSAIFADFYLFESLLGIQKTALDYRVSAHLRELQLDEKVQIKDGVLSTLNLSQGQRKRLALLVSYLENRPIVILDEWAADQDAAFREVFYCQLVPEMKLMGKTVFVISHDERYYHIADRIIKLDTGQVVDDRQLQKDNASEMVV
ncbi:MAG TPA: cyclic peptide export ABC transporter [Candidatus Angelobacter sp.]|nr:cyclic peptide export ABC transporter [Candidatus Angelobacter sp.]